MRSVPYIALAALFMLAACGGGGSGGKTASMTQQPPQAVDTDNDGVADARDAFPNDAAETMDTDNDGVGDNADAFPNDAAETMDTDNDGVGDNADAFPNDAAETMDADSDGVGDNADAFPNDAAETMDTDNDGVGDNADAFPNDAAETMDTDNDGVGDNADAFPNDAAETMDADSDGVGDNADAFPNDAAETMDADSDGVGDNADAFPNDAAETMDTDNDGVGDNADAFPNDAAETMDTDNDGVGDNADAFPNDAAETMDADSDGVGDNADAFPNDAAETMDADSDGVGDNADATTAAPKITTKFGKTKLDYYPLNAVNVCAGQDQCWAMVKEESNIASREDVIAMLKENTVLVTINGKDRLVGIPAFPTPPVVRFVEGTGSDARAATVRAIDNINAWLPWEKHVTVGDDLDTATSEQWKSARYVHHENYGEIHASVYEDPNANFASGGPSGISIPYIHVSDIQHELLHAMGIVGGRACVETFGDACNNNAFDGPMFYYSHVPVSEFPESSMAYASPYDDAHGLSQIDGEVLQTVYGVLHDSLPSYVDVISGVPNADPEYIAYYQSILPGALIALNDDAYPLSLGPWDDEVIRYRGDFSSSIGPPWEGECYGGVGACNYVEPAFGVDWRNGMARPWANGDATLNRFADSGLSGSATWNGELVGFTPAREAVQGDSAINVDLATMAGNAAFTALEHWNAGAPPGGRGTGAQWHDGDLHYTLALDGNYLRSNGGDEGYVSGRFVGEEHQGTVGILERPDLTGAFGAVRQ